MLPSMWLKSVINPIPKGFNKDPFVSLNYKGISLLSCVWVKYFLVLLIRELSITVRVILFMKLNKMGLALRNLVNNISMP